VDQHVEIERDGDLKFTMSADSEKFLLPVDSRIKDTEGV
jgi:hypothetical protein